MKKILVSFCMAAVVAGLSSCGSTKNTAVLADIDGEWNIIEINGTAVVPAPGHGGAMRAVFESVGIHNVLAKSKGSSNPHNLVKATVAALAEMRDAYTVAGLRGIPMSRVFKG